MNPSIKTKNYQRKTMQTKNFLNNIKKSQIFQLPCQLLHDPSMFVHDKLDSKQYSLLVCFNNACLR